jgi:hypothetical protein
MTHPMLSAEMTEYVIKEVGRHQWLVFADRQSIAVCADENEAVKFITEHSAAKSRSRNSADDNCAEQTLASVNRRL